MGLLLAGLAVAWTPGRAAEENSAQALLRSGEYARAKELFELDISSRKNVEESQEGLIRTLRETGEYREALRRSEEFLSQREGFPPLHLERAAAALEVGNYLLAEKHLRRALELAPPGSNPHFRAARRLAELMQSLGRRADAAVFYDQLLDVYRAGPVRGSERLGDVATAAWRRGYVHDAQNIFIDATDSKVVAEISIETLSDFGYLFLEKYHFTDAMGVFRDCLRINKSYPPALLGIALAKRYENPLETEAYARAALAVNPNFVPGLNLLAELDIDEEDYDGALRKIRAALAVNPANLISLSLEAVCFFLKEDFPGFSRNERKILDLHPSYGRLYYILAENLVSRRKYREAVDYDRKAIALDAELWAAHASLGMNLTRIGEFEEGRRSIERAFEGDPFNVWAYNSLDLFDQMDGFGYVQSENFRYRMSKEDEAVLAPYAVHLAEEMYAALTRRYGFRPSGPIHIEMFPDHGGFAVRTLGLPGLGEALGVCFGKVIAMDSPRAQKAGSFNWGSTLWHEFVHVMTLQMTQHNIPRWYSEGLSVYEEQRARPGWGDNLTAAFVRAYQEGKLLKASELNSGIVRPKFPEQIMLSYFQAGLFCEMIEEKFGFEKIRVSLLLFAENRNSEDVFRQALGLDAAALDAEYARYLDSRLRGIASNLRSAGRDAAAGTSGDSGKSGAAKLVQQFPDDFFANLNMGTLLHKEKDFSGAEVYLKKARQLFPHYTETGNPYRQLADIYLAQKREGEALAELHAWRRINGNTLEPLVEAADMHLKRKEWDAAAELLELAVCIHPYDLSVQKKLGEASLEAGRRDVAVRAFRALVALDKTDAAGAHYELARALAASGKEREARREVLRSLEIAPTFLKAQQLLLQLNQRAAP